jgi:hypothetical protein
MGDKMFSYMKVRSAIAGIVLTLAFACADGAIAQSARGTADDFLAQYNAADAQGRQLLEMFIAGQERGLLTANQYLTVVKSKNTLYCPTDDVGLTPPQLIDAIRKIVTTDNRSGSIPLSVVVLVALQRNFPCASPASPK